MAIKRIIKTHSLEETLASMKKYQGQARYIAGGTDLMISLRSELLPEEIDTLIDVSSVQDLSFIRRREHSSSTAPPNENHLDKPDIEIGGGTTFTRLSSSSIIRSEIPILQQAAESVGTPQIRNRGTIAGNIVTAAQCADTVPPLLTLNAQLVLVNCDGNERIVPVADCFPRPKQSAVRPDELLFSIRVAVPGPSWRCSFYKLMRRSAAAKSRLTFSLMFKISGTQQEQKHGGKEHNDVNSTEAKLAGPMPSPDSRKIIESARISIGSALPTPGRFPTAEAVLKGQAPSESVFSQAAEQAAAYMIERSGRRWSTPYKEPVIKGVLMREFIRLCPECGIIWQGPLQEEYNVH